jgi:hypothetical protein
VSIEDAKRIPYWCCVLGKAAYCTDDCTKCAEVNREFWKEKYGETDIKYVEIKEEKVNN